MCVVWCGVCVCGVCVCMCVCVCVNCILLPSLQLVCAFSSASFSFLVVLYLQFFQVILTAFNTPSKHYIYILSHYSTYSGCTPDSQNNYGGCWCDLCSSEHPLALCVALEPVEHDVWLQLRSSHWLYLATLSRVYFRCGCSNVRCQ